MRSMYYRVPQSASAGIMFSYKCTAACKHCMYACSPQWDADWMSKDDLYELLCLLAPSIEPSMLGDSYIGVNEGIHFSGGEPFLNFDLLCEGVRMAKELKIPSVFVETNSFWATSDAETREKLETLKKLGMDGILVSVNPFFLEYIPFERTRRAAVISQEVFGMNAIVYQPGFYRKFLNMGLTGRLSFDDYIARESRDVLSSEVEFFIAGRAPYQMEQYGLFPLHPASVVRREPCIPPLVQRWHNHFDNYGNFQPGFCGGISLGNWKDLPQMTTDGIDLDQRPVLKFLLRDDFNGLLDYAGNRGYVERENGYLSKCHLCLDIRRFLVQQEDYVELRPKAFYEWL